MKFENKGQNKKRNKFLFLKDKNYNNTSKDEKLTLSVVNDLQSEKTRLSDEFVIVVPSWLFFLGLRDNLFLSMGKRWVWLGKYSSVGEMRGAGR